MDTRCGWHSRYIRIDTAGATEYAPAADGIAGASTLVLQVWQNRHHLHPGLAAAGTASAAESTQASTQLNCQMGQQVHEYWYCGCS